MECPEHALRIYKSDQQSKYLLVHQETRAKEVVMLALQEFGITEVSSNYCLYEVTVENGSVRQKLQPDDQTNLAERIGISSRYYIKNRMSSDQLITDDVESELSKESIIHLLDLSPMEAAMQLMVEDFTTFQSIGKNFFNFFQFFNFLFQFLLQFSVCSILSSFCPQFLIFLTNFVTFFVKSNYLKINFVCFFLLQK